MKFAKIFDIGDTQLLLQTVLLDDDKCGIQITTTFDDKELSGVLMFREVDNDGGEVNAAELFENIDQDEAEKIYRDLRDEYLMFQMRQEVLQ